MGYFRKPTLYFTVKRKRPVLFDFEPFRLIRFAEDYGSLSNEVP